LAILPLLGPGLTAHNEAFVAPRAAIGKQLDIRAAALKRIEAALKETGVRFADGVSTVVVKG